MKDFEAKRKFNKKRLYKLAKLLVIITSVLSGALAVITLYMVFSGAAYKNWSYGCKDYPDGSRLRHECVWLAVREEGKLYKQGEKSIIIAVVLPVVFFGGGFLYKYLFPKTE